MSASGVTMRFHRAERLALALAIVAAHLFYWRIARYPSDFDAQNYLDIAADIARHGLFSKFFYSNVRTYGYPLFLAGLKAIAGAQPAWGWLVFEVQLALFVASAWLLRGAIAARAPTLARWAYVALVVNPFVLSYTPETLSESLSLTLAVAAAACWLYARAAPTQERRLVFVGSVIVSLSVMVRPANVFALAAWVIAVALLVYERRMRWRSAAAFGAILVIGTAIPVLPQLANNTRHYGEATPLVVARLGTNQQIWGIQYIKYATAMPPVPLPSVFYYNPFADGRPIDAAHPLEWYANHPVAGLATMGLHVFNMLDQDLLFTYSRDLDPWYRVPIGILNHALVAMALVGLALLFAQWKHHAIEAAALAALVVAHLAVHATAAVEMRFGLPLLALAGPLAVWACLRLHARHSRALVIGTVAFAGVYVLGALALSAWVRSQSPSITAWSQTQLSNH